MYEYIKKSVKSLTEKYQSNNPFELCDYLNIEIIKEDLGTVYGYYAKFFNIKTIHINENLSYNTQLFVCGHELGHAILHQNWNTVFLTSHTFYSVSKLEKEANLFTSFLLIPPEIFYKYKNTSYTLKQISSAEYIPFELLKLYIKNLI